MTKENKDKVKIMVCTPIYSSVTSDYLKSTIDLTKLAKDSNIDLVFEFTEGLSLVEVARNVLAWRFLDSDCTHMVFIDSDIYYDPVDVLSLVDVSRNDGKDVVCGLYPAKFIDWNDIAQGWTLGDKDAHLYGGRFVTEFLGDIDENLDTNKPLEIRNSGTGFMCIKRETLEKFIEFFPDRKVKFNDKGEEKLRNRIFQMGVDDNQKYTGEDYMFCEDIRKAGMKLWCCPWMSIGHRGSFMYFANFERRIKTYKKIKQLEQENEKRGETEH